MNPLTDTAFYVTFTCVAVPLSGGLAAGWAANHTGEIRQSWQDGCAQLAVWRDQIDVNARPMWHAVKLAVLRIALPATGQHRAEVTR